MKLQSTFNCHNSNTLSSGIFLHMFWECPIVANIWDNVNLVLSSLLQMNYMSNPGSCLLNDNSVSCISLQKIMLFMYEEDNNTELACSCAKTYWIHSHHTIVNGECRRARINKAQPSTIDAWQCFSSKILDCIKE